MIDVEIYLFKYPKYLLNFVKLCVMKYLIIATHFSSIIIIFSYLFNSAASSNSSFEVKQTVLISIILKMIIKVLYCKYLYFKLTSSFPNPSPINDSEQKKSGYTVILFHIKLVCLKTKKSCH